MPGIVVLTVLVAVTLLVRLPSTASNAKAPRSTYKVPTKSEVVELPIIFKIGAVVSTEVATTETSLAIKALFPAVSDTE